MNQFEIFSQLHNGATPLLLGNCWDVSSAKLLEANSFKAVATSSAAVAQALGYEDGENMPFDLLLATAKRIRQHITVPLSVDIEKGYSESINGLFENVQKLYDIGVAGINIEDSANDKTLQPAAVFAKRITVLADALTQKNMQVFINARTDAFLLHLPDALHESTKRIDLYENAGASGIFVPFIKDGSDIKTVVSATALPVNVLPVVGLPGIATLTSLGVRRISLGSSLFNALNRQTANLLREIQEKQSFDALF